MRFRSFIVGSLAIALAWAIWFLPASTAIALPSARVSDVGYRSCPAGVGEGIVTSGSIASANCFLVYGQLTNTTGKSIYNADIFGRIYDANHNPVMQNRTRLGGVDEIPPGKSTFEIRISVAANQPEPLQLEQFKASGFTGKVRR